MGKLDEQQNGFVAIFVLKDQSVPTRIEACPPANPAGGGTLSVENGPLKSLGSNGMVTVFAPTYDVAFIKKAVNDE